MQLHFVWAAGRTLDVAEVEVAPASNLTELLQVAVLGTPPGDAREPAVLAAARRLGLEPPALLAVHGLLAVVPPPDGGSQVSSVVRRGQRHCLAYVLGEPGAVLELCRHARWDDHTLPLDEAMRRGIELDAGRLAAQGLRVSAAAVRLLEADRPALEARERELTLFGLLAFEPGAPG